MDASMNIEEAVQMIISETERIDDELSLPLEEAYGHILADDIKAYSPVPAFPRSAMDGYAVRSDDAAGAGRETPVRLKVSCEILAGDSKDISYTPGTAVRVMTGAMIPDGYDAVIKQEDTDYGEDEVLIFSSAEPGLNYCPVGEEIEKGETVIRAGTRIGRVETGLIASLGIAEVRIRRPARIALISTGSELTKPGEKLPEGKIYGNIRYMLAASVRQDGLEASYSTDCADDKELICSHIMKAAAVSDMLITTGGVSVGRKDLLPEALDAAGARRLFAGVDIQPGTPTMASIYDGKLILSLSGNPYAALANFDLYFPPCISKLMGSEAYLEEIKEAELADTYDKVNRMRRLIRAYEKDGKVYLPAAVHRSSVFGNMGSCNCYMDIPAGTKLEVGDKVRIRKTRYR